jgi:hypothetical protein
MSPKHIPLRTCVQCQQVKAKRELTRVVRGPQGTVEVDEKGKTAGRGAYLCRNRVCWERALAGERLDHALKTSICAEDRRRLVEYSIRFPAVKEEPVDKQKGERAATLADG